jgi:hypothetical protein
VTEVGVFIVFFYPKSCNQPMRSWRAESWGRRNGVEARLLLVGWTN